MEIDNVLNLLKKAQSSEIDQLAEIFLKISSLPKTMTTILRAIDASIALADEEYVDQEIVDKMQEQAYLIKKAVMSVYEPVNQLENEINEIIQKDLRVNNEQDT